MKKENVKAAVETAVEDTIKAVEEIGKAAEPTVKKAKAAAKSVAKKAEPAVKAAVSSAKSAAKKAEPAVKAAVDSAKVAGKAAAASAKDTGKKVANALVAEIYIQQGGAEYDCEQIIERCKEDFRANNKGTIRSCKVYIKPEDGMAYYVINDVASKIAL